MTDARPYDGRIALVTGAGGGIGGVTARAFARRGYVVVAADLYASAARATVDAARADVQAKLTAEQVAADARLAERFELYACGVELANGFGELTNAAEQRLRFDAEMDEKHRVYGERYPLDEDLLAALPFMPAASGIALGFDRLVMLATGAPKIDDVIWTPVA